MVASYKTHIKLKKDARRIFSTNELNDRNKGLQEITEILSNMKIAYFSLSGIPHRTDIRTTIKRLE